MAKKMDKSVGETVVHGANLTAFDKKQLKKDIETAIAKRTEMAQASQDNGAFMTMVEKDRGYNKAAFKLLVGLSSKSLEYRSDFIRTLMAGLDAADMMPKPDLVDLAQNA